MIARIHHVKNGIEYVLQYNSNTDTIESRKNRLTLIGGVPNYFRESGLKTALEAHTFKITLRNWRPLTIFSEALNRLPAPLNRLPALSDEEKDLIHEFEKIAEINLYLTPESVRAENPNMNTEGMTEEQVQDNLEFVARLLNGETIPATEFPSRDLNNNDAVLDRLLKEIEEAIEDNDTDRVRGAPTHPI